MVSGSIKKKKITAEIVATTSLPVDRLTATDCNAAARAKIMDQIMSKTIWSPEKIKSQKEIRVQKNFGSQS